MTRWEVTKAVRASDLPPPSRLIMLTLADVAEVGTAEIPPRFTPSLKQLARETGLDKSTVTRHLDSLDRGGWLVRTRPDARAQWEGERTRYRLTIPEGFAAPEVDAESTHLDAQDTYPGAENNQGGRTEGQGVGAENVGGSRTEHPLKTDLSDQGQISSDPSSSKKRTTRGTRLPDDFEATPEMIEWARQKTPNVGLAETEAFIDWFRSAPGQKGVKTDWVATWRNWMRKAQKDFESRRHSSRTTGANRHVDQRDDNPFRNGANATYASTGGAR